MAKVTIYLPDELAAQVKDSGISVSPVCQRALQQEVRTMKAMMIDDDEIAQAAQRLIAEEGEEVMRARAEGTRVGRFWALNLAAPAELRRMQGLVRDGRFDLDGRVEAYVGTGVSRLEEAAFETIRQMVAEDGELQFDGDALSAYWDAFEDGALNTYDEVTKAIRRTSLS